jgi:cell division septum initiation protein DivIVA
MTPGPGAAPLSAEAIRSCQFPTSGYGRGFEKQAVRHFVEQVAAGVEDLQRRLRECRAEVTRLERRVIEGPDDDGILQAVNVISNAQRTADATIAEANAYSARVMSEARNAYDESRKRAAQLQEAAEESVRRLSVSAQMEQEELDKQTAYLRTLRDSIRTQMEKYLEGMLFHVAEEYGRAHPIAAEASVADQPGRAESHSNSEHPVNGNGGAAGRNGNSLVHAGA